MVTKTTKINKTKTIIMTTKSSAISSFILCSENYDLIVRDDGRVLNKSCICNFVFTWQPHLFYKFVIV